MTWIFSLGAAFCLIAAIASFGFALVCGADPEGRGGDLVMYGIGGAAAFSVFFIVLTVAALYRAFGG